MIREFLTGLTLLVIMGLIGVWIGYTYAMEHHPTRYITIEECPFPGPEGKDV